MNAKRIGIAVSGFDVHHAHLHLVPLHCSNELFDASKFYRASQKELEDNQKLLANKLKEMN